METLCALQIEMFAPEKAFSAALLCVTQGKITHSGAYQINCRGYVFL